MKAFWGMLPILLLPQLVRGQTADELITVRQLSGHVMQVSADTLGSAVGNSGQQTPRTSSNVPAAETKSERDYSEHLWRHCCEPELGFLMTYRRALRNGNK